VVQEHFRKKTEVLAIDLRRISRFLLLGSKIVTADNLNDLVPPPIDFKYRYVAISVYLVTGRMPYFAFHLVVVK